MSKPIIPKWVKRWEAWLAFFMLLAGGYAGLAATIPDFPRWTWFSEHKTLVKTHETDTIFLAGEIKFNTITLLEDKVSFLRREGRALRAAQRDYKLKGDHDPRLQQDIEENEDKLRDAENKLKAKRGH